MTKTLICLRIIKNNALLETFRRNPRKREEGDRRSGFERCLKDMREGQAKIFPPKTNGCLI